MVDIQHILCPIDFSEPSRHALAHAVLVAKWYGSRITALHVLHAPLFPQPPIFAVQFADAPAAMSTPQTCEQQLQTWLDPAHRAGVTADAHVTRATNAAAGIVDNAASLHADLIVIGTHGLSGFDRFVLGSVCEKVLRKAAGPVLTVPPALAMTSTVPYTGVLCPVDFSESSLNALQFAFSIAKEADATLTILHAFDWPPDDELLVERFDAPEFRRVVEASVRRRLEVLVPDDVRASSKPSTRVEYGKPYQRILDVASREAADVIVMGVRGRNPVDLALFGSTTNHVVRRATCPVLTLRT